MRRTFSYLSAGVLLLGAHSLGSAGVSAEEAARLGGKDLTCMGALRAGSDAGVAEYTGKYQGSWPGMSKPYGWEPGPYADEKPLYVIDHTNMAEYAHLMTDGQKALMEKYPDSYRMRVFPSHRDFKAPDWVCDVVKKNATYAEVVNDGLGIKGYAGAHPFPFPKNGLEGIWNVINPYRTGSEQAVFDIADVYANGSIAWGRVKFRTMNTGTQPDRSTQPLYEKTHVNGFFFLHFLLPDREKGFVAVGYQPNAFDKDATQSWQYLPGIRRVRKAPEVGFDYPVPPSGLRTADDDYIFNGSPERYNWKLVGRKELLVPYHNFEFNSPELSYDDIIRPNTVNPDHMRYELHRVWVIEGNLKPGVRHIYKRRVIYADEDSWLSMWGDNYDGQDQLWRVSMIAFFYSQESSSFHRGASIYHDLTSGNYEATYLTNEAGDNWWRLNQPMDKRSFSPEAAARAGQ